MASAVNNGGGHASEQCLLEFYLVDKQAITIPAVFSSSGSIGRRSDIIEISPSSLRVSRALKYDTRMVSLLAIAKTRSSIGNILVTIRTANTPYEKHSLYSIIVEGNAFASISTVFENYELRLGKLEVQNLQWHTTQNRRFGVDSVQIVGQNFIKDAGNQNVFTDNRVSISAEVFQMLQHRNNPLYGTVSLKMQVIAKLNDSIKDVSPANLNKMILLEEIESDVIIVSSDDAESKCHKVFLAAKSAVFRAMFNSNLQESRAMTIEMPDMSKEGVQAFLRYIYYCDIDVANNEVDIAFELFQAGHKYDISPLEEKMRHLLLTKPVSWYNVEVALEIFLFARNTEDEELKLKAIKMLKSYFKTLVNSPSYKKLFKDDHAAAMELCNYSFAI